MIIVTGAAGFIGSNIIKGLNEIGRKDIIAVDDLTDGTKFKNMVDCEVLDYLDAEDFLHKIVSEQKLGDRVEAVFHEGACSVTTEWNGRFMMKNNYEYSKQILQFCESNQASFIYASSAAIYGNGTQFNESPEFEAPLNVYGYSKFLFDQYVRRYIAAKQSKIQIVGLRYFNVYGPRESHKASMASVAFHFNNQIKTEGVVKLFTGSDGYGNGEQRRDFIFVGDVVAVNLWFLKNRTKHGIFNVGTGRSQSFNDVANAVIAWHNTGKIHYVTFPDHLRGRYQSFTEANISNLRQAGFDGSFKTVEEGVKLYLDWLNKQPV